MHRILKSAIRKSPRHWHYNDRFFSITGILTPNPEVTLNWREQDNALLEARLRDDRND